MRIDETGNENAVGAIDCDRIGRGNVRADFAKLPILDQDIARRKIADCPIQREDDASLQQNPPRSLYAGELCARRLGQRIARRQRDRCPGRKACAGFQKIAT
jgi:hypothetical protein